MVRPMRFRLPALLCSCALVVLATPDSALAIDFCVPSVAACPGGVGTMQPDLQGALDQAANTGALDRIFLAAGTFTAPTTAGFSYGAATAPVQIAGAGSSGAQKTVITSPAGSNRVLQLLAAPGSSLSGVELAVADNAPFISFQLSAGNVDIGDTVLTSSATQSNTYFGILLEAGATFHDGAVTVSPTQGHAVLQDGEGTSIARATLSGYSGVEQNAAVGTTTIDRVRIVSGDGGGIFDAGATVTVTNSLVLQGGTAAACALKALDQPASDAVINADGVTMVGTGGLTRGACATSFTAAPRSATVNVTNSIFRSLDNDRNVGASNTGTAAVNVTYSDFDPSTDIVVGPGPTSLSPAQGVLGAGNVTVDPLFLGPADYHLGAGSPVGDIGDPGASGGLDLDGLPRLCGRRDLGAFERQAGGTCVAVGDGVGDGDPPAPPAPVPAPHGPTSSPASPDITGPELRLLALSHRSFRVGRRGTASTGTAAKAAPAGTTFRFTLSESAAVTIRLQRRATRRGKPVRYATRAQLRRSAHAGRVSVPFSGRVGKAILTPGRYRALLEAVDAAGNHGRSRTIAFTVLAHKM